MSKKKDTSGQKPAKAQKEPQAQPEPQDQYPSAKLLADLQDVRKETDEAKRSLLAWRLVTRAYGNNDAAVVYDFALENDLIRPCDIGTSKGKRGEAVQNINWTNPIDGSEMIWIPPGPFFVGKDKQRAESKGFSLARFPVTNAQFQTFLEETNYRPAVNHPDEELFLSHWTKGKIPKGKEDHPVVYVSYIDAIHYCKWAGLTLPTQWLWEKAARGPDGRAYPWGDQPPERSSKTLTNVNSRGTVAVGHYPRTRTAYGCEDMIGNVSEWCQPGKDKEQGYMPEHHPEVPLSFAGKIPYTHVRGSCFLRSAASRMICAHQRRLSITRRNFWVGFRPALFLPVRPAQ